MTTYRSPLLQRAALALLLASAGLAAAPAAYAGRAKATSNFIPFVHNTSTPVPGITAEGRACVKNAGGGGAVDPAGACNGVFRNITPPLPPAFAVTALASAKASIIPLAGGGSKQLDADVINFGFAFAEAEVVDPITFAAQPTAGVIDVNLTLDMNVEADVNGTALAETNFLSDLTGSEKLFDIRLVASNGGAATLQLTVSPFLVAQGWNRATLESDLNAALLAGGGGTLTGFALPVISFTQPANTELNLFDNGLAQVDTVPEPGTCALLAIGALGAWLPGLRSRRSATGAGSGRSASGAGRYSGSLPGQSSHPLPA